MSMTISGLIITIVGFLLQQLGVPYAEEELRGLVGHAVAIVALVGQAAGIVIAWYGRYRQGDVTLIGQRRAVSPPAGRLP
ncbi:MAG: hypothetical protein ACREM3_18570 [Candidatus Rokuibacteriota bacterium]